jgi:hypothetical protein
MGKSKKQFRTLQERHLTKWVAQPLALKLKRQKREYVEQTNRILNRLKVLENAVLYLTRHIVYEKSRSSLRDDKQSSEPDSAAKGGAV